MQKDEEEPHRGCTCIRGGCRRQAKEQSPHHISGSVGGGGAQPPPSAMSGRGGRVKAPGVLALPAPCVSAHLVHGLRGLPVQLRRRLVGVGPERREVAGPAWPDLVGQGLARGLFHGLHQLQDGDRIARAQVVHVTLPEAHVAHPLDGGHVAVRQVHHMDEVPPAGAIGSVVGLVAGPSEHGEAFARPHCDLGNVRHQVVGDPLRVLPDFAAGMGPDWIEIPQDDQGPVLARWRRMQVTQNLLDHEFGPAVRVCDADPHLTGLRVRDGGRAIHRCRRRENQPSALILVHTS
mmetsp:Transcript_64632/g.107087  ORF Transcript_64632/g.107087 Transcript_64632/m.107087 type:complete len:291 (-) Transcript_64632:361-1233(-)